MRSRWTCSVLITALAAVAGCGGSTPSSHSTGAAKSSRPAAAASGTGLVVYEQQSGAYPQLFAVNADGTQRRQLTRFADSGATNPAWASNGSRIAFTRHWSPDGGPDERTALYTMKPDGTGLRAVRVRVVDPLGPAWLPDNESLLLLDLSGPAFKVVRSDGSGLRNAAGWPGDSPVVHPDGKHFAVLRPHGDNEEETAIFIARLDGSSAKRISPWGSHGDKLDFSPDGSRIVFTEPGFDEPGRAANVYTMRTDGSDRVQLTHSRGDTVDNGANSWSPDGKRIAFVSNRSGTFQIYSMDTRGGHVGQLSRGGEAHRADWGATTG